MKTLFLDIASHKGTIACVDDAVRSIAEADHRVRDDQLIPLIEKTLSDAGWKYEDLDRIACVTGPGGFTSLRVAVACSNTLSHALEIPQAALHLSDVYAARSTEETFLWLHSTKSDAVFVRGFGEWSEVWKDAQYISLAELTDVIQTKNLKLKTVSWTGELLSEHQNILKLQPLELAPLQDILPEFLNSQTYSHQLLAPWYGRGY